MSAERVSASLLRDEIRAAEYDRRSLRPTKVAQYVQENRAKADACLVRAREHRDGGSPTSAFSYELRRLSYLRQADFLEVGPPQDFDGYLADQVEMEREGLRVLEEEAARGYPLPWEDTVVMSRCPRYNVGGRLVSGLVSDGGGRGAYAKWNACILDQTYGAWVPIFPQDDRDFYTRDDAKAWVAGMFAQYRDNRNTGV